MPEPATQPGIDLPPPPSEDLMAALKLYVDLANSEKQAIWARHATMVVGNSLLINAVMQKPEAWTNRFLNIAGLFICFLWTVMTWVGWDWFRKSLREGKALSVHPSLNPFSTYDDIGDRHSDTI